MTLTLDQAFVNDFQALVDRLDCPELLVAALLVDLAWHREQANQDQRIRWISLTHRQQQIAALIRAGHTFSEIGVILELSKNSVHTQTRYIYAKMGVNSQQELRDLMLKSELLDEYMGKYTNPE